MESNRYFYHYIRLLLNEVALINSWILSISFSLWACNTKHMNIFSFSLYHVEVLLMQVITLFFSDPPQL